MPKAVLKLFTGQGTGQMDGQSGDISFSLWEQIATD